jgi:very-short-patch-repair endonuclease
MKTDKKWAFLTRWRQLAPDLPEPIGEHRGIPGRKFQFDWAWPDHMLAVEIDGGNHLVRKGRAVGRHTQDSDYWKHNLAVLAGWRVLRFTTGMLRDDPTRCIETTKAALMESE